MPIQDRDSPTDTHSLIPDAEDSPLNNSSNNIIENSQPENYTNGKTIVQNEKDISQENKSPVKVNKPGKLPALDGGWGWCVVFGCCLMHFLMGGFGRSFGIIYVKMLERFDCSAATGSTIGGVFTSVRMGAGPLISVMTQRFSVRSVTSVGALVFALGSLLCAFVTSPFQMFLTYSLLSGLGGAMVYFPGVVIVGQYFDKRRGLAMGLSTAGSGIGCMVFPPIYQVLFDIYSWGGTFIIVCGFILNFLICSVLYRPLAESWRGINVALRRQLRLDAEKGVEKKIESSEGDTAEDLSPDGPITVQNNRPAILAYQSDGVTSYQTHIGSDISENSTREISVGNEMSSSLRTVVSRDEDALNRSLTKSLTNSVRPNGDTSASNNISVSNENNAAEIEQSNNRTRSSKAASSSNADQDNSAAQRRNSPSDVRYRQSNSSITNSQSDDESSTERKPLLATKKEKSPSLWQKVDSYLGLSLLANPAFSCFVLASGLGTMAYISAQNLIVAHANIIGIDPNLSVYILSTIGIADTIGRVLSGVLFDIPVIRRLRMFLYTFILLGSGLSIIGWAFCTDIYELMALSLANGLFNGGIVTSRPVIVADLVGIENMAPAFGMTVFSQGVFIIIGPFIAGYLKDITEDYVMSYVFSGLSSCLAALLYIIGYKIGPHYKCCKCGVDS